MYDSHRLNFAKTGRRPTRTTRTTTVILTTRSAVGYARQLKTGIPAVNFLIVMKKIRGRGVKSKKAKSKNVFKFSFFGLNPKF